MYVCDTQVYAKNEAEASGEIELKLAETIVVRDTNEVD